VNVIFNSGTKVAVTVKACNRTDLSCATPVDTQTTDTTTETVTMNIPLSGAPFDGYFELTDASGVNAQMLAFSGELGDSNQAELFIFIMYTPAVLAQGFGDFVATKGYLYGYIQDCSGSTTAGVTAVLSPANSTTRILYGSGTTSTAADGNFGVAGASLGAATMTLTNAAGATVLAQPVIFRANALTFLQRGPNQ
jgi:hypothetical protein